MSDRLSAWLSRNHGFVAWGLTVLLGLLIAYLTGQPAPPIPAPPPLVEGERPEPQPVAAPPVPVEFGQGWVIDPDEVAAVTQTLPVRVFRDTPAGQLKADELPKSVYGWKPYTQLFGRPPPVKNQGQVGSCVSFGTNTAVERTLACEIVIRKGSRAEWSRFVEEATYGGSRVEIGGGRINGDGSVGAWAAQWVTKWGMVPRKAYPSRDLSTYSESLCREWGRAGVPAEFEQVAKTFPVKSTVLVKTWTEAKAALAQGYMIAVCSNQGFTMARDANGVCRPSGSWAHCMCLDGYHTDDATGKEYGHITNSWGDRAHTGPVGWGEPNPDGFWADASVVAGMLRQGDSWAFSGVTGFPKREPLNWTKAEPAGHPVVWIRTRPLPFSTAFRVAYYEPGHMTAAEARRWAGSGAAYSLAP